MMRFVRFASLLFIVTVLSAGCAATLARIPGTEDYSKRKLMVEALMELADHMEAGSWEKVWDYFPPDFQAKYPRAVYAQVMKDRGITYRKSGEPSWWYDNRIIAVKLPFHVEAPGRAADRTFKVNFRWIEDSPFGWVRDPERIMPPPGSVELRQERPAPIVAPAPTPATPPTAAAPANKRKKRPRF